MKKLILILLLSHSFFAQYHTWREISSPVTSPAGMAINSNDEFFVLGDGKLYKTTDEGVNYTSIADGQQGIVFQGLYVDQLDRLFLYNQNHIAIYIAESDSFSIIKEISGNLQGCQIFEDNILAKINGEFYFTSDFGESWNIKPDIPANIEKYLLKGNNAYFSSDFTLTVYNLVDETFVRTYTLPDDDIYTYKLMDGSIYVLFGDSTYVTHNEFETLELFTGNHCFYLAKDPEGNFIIDYYGLSVSGDGGQTWSSMNVPWFEILEPKRFLMHGNDKYYFLGEKLFIYNGENNYFTGENFMPMELGNEYLYKNVSYSGFGSSTSYSIKRISADTLLENQHFFKFDDDTFWYGYSQDENVLYRLNPETGDVKIQFDFSYYPYATQEALYYASVYMAEVADDSVQFCGNSVYAKSFNGWAGSGTRWVTYLENIGFYYVTQTGAFEWWEDASVLKEAIIYDVDSNFTYHKSGARPVISNIETHVQANTITISFNHSHPFDTDDYLWNKEAILEYYFDFGYGLQDTVYQTKDPAISNLLSFDVPFDTNYVNLDTKLYYKVYVTDNNLIPNEVSYPEEGYAYVDSIYTPITVSVSEIKYNFCYEIKQNYPNPFNPETKITYSIKDAGYVELIVYDVLGNEVAKLVNEYKPAGIHEVNFNAANLPSGVYLYRINTGEFTQTRKMILLK